MLGLSVKVNLYQEPSNRLLYENPECYIVVVVDICCLLFFVVCCLFFVVCCLFGFCCYLVDAVVVRCVLFLVVVVVVVICFVVC